MEWTTLIHTCKLCGASWKAPRDEPHDCLLLGVREEAESYRDALLELVRLKDGPRDEAYERDKPRAWERARELVIVPTAATGEEAE